MTGPPRLRDSDSADHVQLVRVAVLFGPACFTMLSMLWFFFRAQGWISDGVFVALLLLNIPLTAGGVLAIHHVTSRAARGFARVVLAGGDIPPPPTYPRQDVLIVRGQYAEAADYFRDHIRIDPADHEARLRLAQLLETHLKGYDEAERLYQEVRRSQPLPDPGQEMRAANGLIDLYRKTGRIDRLKVELARFADRYRGSAVAEGASRELRELKGAEITNESPHSPT